MEQLVCRTCMKVHTVEDGAESCPVCGGHRTCSFRNSGDFLRSEVPGVRRERERAGLDRLTGRLRCVVINVEPGNLDAAVSELPGRSGFDVSDAFENTRFRTVVLSAEDSADLLVRCRLEETNPFMSVPGGPGSGKPPSTRIETLFFETPDMQRYAEIWREGSGLPGLGGGQG